MFRAYKLLSSCRTPSIRYQTILSNEKGHNNILNLSKKTFFKKTNTLCLAAGKKDYYSN